MVTAEHPRVLLWHANYHPDGGQLFFPLNGEAFVCPLALPGDDVKPEDFVAFYVDGGKGLYIHPNIWHEAVFPLAGRASFYDEQGKVHARVSCNIAAEFGVFLSVPLAAAALTARPSFDVAIVGAGIVGLAHALAAARAGAKVLVLDRDAQANGASIRNFGYVTVTGQSADDTWQRARRTRDVWDEIAPQSGNRDSASRHRGDRTHA